MGRNYAEKDALESGWGIGACTRCGKTLVLGEPVLTVSTGERSETVCADCAVSPRRQFEGSIFAELEWIELPQVA